MLIKNLFSKFSLTRGPQRLFSKTVPAIASDIDGVVIRGSTMIGNSREAIKRIKLNKAQIPFTLLTNGGGNLEATRAGVVNEIIDMEKDFELTGDEMICCQTPLRDLVHNYDDQNVLVMGLGNTEILAKEYGLKNFLTIEEYTSLYPQFVPLL